MSAEVSYSQIGALLKTARDDQRIPLDQAARELHIRPRYLQALEEGRFGELPGAAYIKGYLQSYAGYLQMDKDEVLRRFEQMDGVLARKAFYFPEVFSREQKPSHNMTYGGLAVAVAVYAIWTLFLAPERKDISLVDPVPSKQEAAQNLSMPRPSTCFGAQEVLYPACYNIREERTMMHSPKRALGTIMQLADY